MARYQVKGAEQFRDRSTYKIAVVISDRAINANRVSSFANTQGIAIELISIVRDIEGGSCEAEYSSISGNYFVARLRAEDTPLHVTTLVLVGEDNEPIKGLKSYEGGSGSEDLLASVLNGDLLPYATDLTTLADHLAIRRETRMIKRAQIYTNPEANEFSRSQVEGDVVLNGSTVAEFTIFQSKTFSEEGALKNIENFRRVRRKNLLLDLGGESKESIDDILSSTSGEFIREEATYSNLSSLGRACAAIEAELEEYKLSNLAIRHVKASMLNDFDKPALLRSTTNNGHQVCLDQDERRQVSFIGHTVIGGKVERNATCQSIVALDASELTDQVTKAGARDIYSNYTTLLAGREIEEGPEFYKIDDQSDRQAAMTGFLSNLSRTTTCQRWSNVDDDAEMIWANPNCQYIFRMQTVGRDAKPVWILMQSKEGAGGTLPVAEWYTLGVDPRNYVTAEALAQGSSRRDISCLEQVGLDLD